MKNRFLCIASMGLLLLTACYDEQKGNDYDTVLPDVKITIPSPAYNAALGNTITVTPDIVTTIEESDLQFNWEIVSVSRILCVG